MLKFDIQPLNPSLTRRYERFTFTRGRSGLTDKCSDQRAVVLAASWLMEPVGLIISRVIPETKMGIINSLFVGEYFRSCGLGTQLLLSAVERLRDKGCQHINVTFPVSTKDSPALLKVLKKCSWNEPTKSHEIIKYHAESFSWINRIRFRGNDRAIPWNEPVPEILDEIKKGEDQWYPRRVSPFHGEKTDHDTSLWFSCDGKIAGWLVTRRVEDILNYDTFYVREELQGTGRAMPLLAEVIKTQLKMGIPYGCKLISYGTDRSNPYLLRFHEKHLKPSAVLLSEYHQAMKDL